MTATTGADVIDITNKDIWDDTELVEAYNSAIQQYLTEHHPNQKKPHPPVLFIILMLKMMKKRSLGILLEAPRKIKDLRH